MFQHNIKISWASAKQATPTFVAFGISWYNARSSRHPFEKMSFPPTFQIQRGSISLVIVKEPAGNIWETSSTGRPLLCGSISLVTVIGHFCAAVVHWLLKF
jgi:hypothetical protein